MPRHSITYYYDDGNMAQLHMSILSTVWYLYNEGCHQVHENKDVSTGEEMTESCTLIWS